MSTEPVTTPPDESQTADAQPKTRKRAAKTTQRQRKTYTVKDGDTLTGIAASLGVSADSLRTKNGLRHDMLFRGQRLSL